MRNVDCRVFSYGKAHIIKPYGNGHNGIDITNGDAKRKDISAHSEGRVVLCQTVMNEHKIACRSGIGRYGNCVRIRHYNGFTTVYAHMTPPEVSDNQILGKGQRIADMGDSGLCRQPCLHFEIWDPQGRPIDPTPYLNADMPGCPTRPLMPPPEVYTPGLYEVRADMVNIRCGPGYANQWVDFCDFAEDAKKDVTRRDFSQPGHYPCGMIIRITEVQNKNWGKCSSGWVCLDYCARAE